MKKILMKMKKKKRKIIQIILEIQILKTQQIKIQILQILDENQVKAANDENLLEEKADKQLQILNKIIKN
jgi:hypothetical protein